MSALKPCRDCGASISAMARSCPRCGILNPVQFWVALPDGSHASHREPVSAAAGAYAAPMPAFAPAAGAFPHPAGAPAHAGHRPTFGAPAKADDKLADWAIWVACFALLRVTVLSGGGFGKGAIAGLIAAVITAAVLQALPARADGRKLPVWLSVVLLVLGVGFLLMYILLGALLAAAVGAAQ